MPPDHIAQMIGAARNANDHQWLLILVGVAATAVQWLFARGIVAAFEFFERRPMGKARPATRGRKSR